jgi:hypothetical protein
VSNPEGVLGIFQDATCSCPDGIARFTHNYRFFRGVFGQGVYPNFPQTSLLSTEDLVDSAMQSASAELYKRAANAKALALVTLHERQETVDMLLGKHQGLINYIKTFANRFASHCRDARKKMGRIKRRALRTKTWKDFRRDLNNLFLEFELGWGPLVGDIDDLTTAILGGGETRSIQKVSSKAGASKTGSTISGKLDYPSHPFDYFDTLTADCTVYMKGGVLITASATMYRAERLGLTPQSIFTSLWEGIPFSFVVDYFTNIGDIIADTSYKASVSFCWTSAAIVTSSRAVRKVLPNGIYLRARWGSTFTGYSFSQEPLVYERKGFRRSSFVDVPLSLDLSIPGTKQSLIVAGLAKSLASASNARNDLRRFR